ncbi:cutinase family protein [Aldersonia sp. NBC_00410]|uniref:cutinase family protein n=1 Tax=Aldersonia sp. NBC_00410 TaxID=2975954 RepID=UPI0022579BF4|nr:cutinase family protein [Aldersonia sp. NBC_00410]MCX5045635.1 cutinase family protein [Aldersonia sp. NBC_00410]
MGLAVLAAAPFLSQPVHDGYESVLTGAGAPGCYDMVSIAIAGKGDTPSSNANNQFIVAADGTVLPAAKAGDFDSGWLKPVVNAPNGAVGSDSYAAIYVDYPANLATYEEAVNAGVDNAETVMKSIAKECPDTKFAVVGYSEGADVARRVAMEIGNQPADDITIVDPNSVVGVVILADAGRSAGEGPFPGAANEFGHPDNFDVAYQDGGNAAGGHGLVSGGSFGALNGKVAAFCSEGDFTCSASEDIALLRLLLNVARQVNVDAIDEDGLTLATGADVAIAFGRVALLAFNDIAKQDNWMKSDETFLDVLVKVSDPSYQPGAIVTPVELVQFTTNQLLYVAYLPAKLVNEVVGLIEDNRNLIQVVQSDPYNQTLEQGVGHHFDYWRDADAANGKPLTSAEYAAAWLTQLAQEAEQGQPSTTEVPDAVELAASSESAASSETAASTETETATPTAIPTTQASDALSADSAAEAGTTSTAAAEATVEAVETTTTTTAAAPATATKQSAVTTTTTTTRQSAATAEEVIPADSQPTEDAAAAAVPSP